MRSSKKNQKLFKVIRIVAIVLLAVLMVAIVYFGSLPKQYDVYQGQVSEYDITASRTVKDSYEAACPGYGLYHPTHLAITYQSYLHTPTHK